MTTHHNTSSATGALPCVAVCVRGGNETCLQETVEERHRGRVEVVDEEHGAVAQETVAKGDDARVEKLAPAVAHRNLG